MPLNEFQINLEISIGKCKINTNEKFSIYNCNSMNFNCNKMSVLTFMDFHGKINNLELLFSGITIFPNV